MLLMKSDFWSIVIPFINFGRLDLTQQQLYPAQPNAISPGLSSMFPYSSVTFSVLVPTFLPLRRLFLGRRRLILAFRQLFVALRRIFLISGDLMALYLLFLARWLLFPGWKRFSPSRRLLFTAWPFRRRLFQASCRIFCSVFLDFFWLGDNFILLDVNFFWLSADFSWLGARRLFFLARLFQAYTRMSYLGADFFWLIDDLSCLVGDLYWLNFSWSGVNIFGL